MTDLVERLRPLAGLDAYYAEALAEIELLRKRNQDRLEHVCATNDKLIAANAEIERLREENERLVELVQTTLRASTDEIGRLRERLKYYERETDAHKEPR